MLRHRVDGAADLRALDARSSSPSKSNGARLQAPRTTDRNSSVRAYRSALRRGGRRSARCSARLAAGDDVEQQPAVGDPLVRRRHLRRERRRDRRRAGRRPGTSGASVSRISAAVVSQASSHHVPVGREHALEAELLGGARDRRRGSRWSARGTRGVPALAGRPTPCGTPWPPPTRRAAVAGGGQEPVQLDAHVDVPSSRSWIGVELVGEERRDVELAREQARSRRRRRPSPARRR